MNKKFPLHAGSIETVDLPEENRIGVSKIVKPKIWYVAQIKLNAFKGHKVRIKFSAEVKRVGAEGDLYWQVNNDGYPVVGNAIKNAAPDIWHSMSGEWTGELTNNKALYLSAYENNTKITTYYIHNFNFEIESLGKREIDLSRFHKNLKHAAEYLKSLLPEEIPEDYEIKPMFKRIASDEIIRGGVVAYRDFLFLLFDRMAADNDLYHKPPKSSDSHLSFSAAFPFINIVKSILFNIGYDGEFNASGDALLIGDWQMLSPIINSEGHRSNTKISSVKIIEALRFLEDCGFYYEGIILDMPKPDIKKIESLEITYPDNPAVLTGLKTMATAQKELNIKNNTEVFLRCDYKVIKNEEPDADSIMNEFIRQLPAEVQEFAGKLHRPNTGAGLTCRPKFSFPDAQHIYFNKNKEVFSFFSSIGSGYRIIIKPKNIQKYSDVIKKFSPQLQERISKGHGCEVQRFGEPCQKGCHGYGFPLDASILDIAKDIEIWIDNEFGCK
ncbi:MAG: hypothetical protein LBI27_02190 [Clostridiales bacterium]|jgi:hypothetical protein|nr:hypothetical protein [Clostridiales bacterium]